MFKKFLLIFLLMMSTGFIHARTTAYVTNSNSNTVSVIDVPTNTVTATIAVGNMPFGVVLSPDGTRAYVANRADATISVIDTPSNTVIATVNIGAPTPAFPAITPDGLTLYVSTGRTITVMDTGTNSVTASIAVDAFRRHGYYSRWGLCLRFGQRHRFWKWVSHGD